MKITLTLLGLVLLIQLNAQFKPIPQRSTNTGPKAENTHYPIKNLPRFNQSQDVATQASIDYTTLPKLNLNLRKPIAGPKFIRDEKSGLPIFIEGEIEGLPELRDAPKAKKPPNTSSISAGICALPLLIRNLYWWGKTRTSFSKLISDTGNNIKA